LKIEKIAPSGHSSRQKPLLTTIIRISTTTRTPILSGKPRVNGVDTPMIRHGIEDSMVAAGQTRQKTSSEFGKKNGIATTIAIRTRYFVYPTLCGRLSFFVGIL